MSRRPPAHDDEHCRAEVVRIDAGRSPTASPARPPAASPVASPAPSTALSPAPSTAPSTAPSPPPSTAPAAILAAALPEHPHPSLPPNVVLLRGRGPSGRVGPIGQTGVAEDEVIRQVVESAQLPIEAYRQQLFRTARIVHEGSTIVDWWHAGQARRAIDAACIQFARLTPAAQRRVLASLPRPRPRLVTGPLRGPQTAFGGHR